MIFDTDILIWVSRDDPHANALVNAHMDRAASIVTLMELLAGARSKAELQRTRRFFVDLEIRLIPIDGAISYLAANLIEYHGLSSGLDLPDALIAATAHEHGEILATANVRHFREIANLAIHPFRPSRRS